MICAFEEFSESLVESVVRGGMPRRGPRVYEVHSKTKLWMVVPKESHVVPTWDWDRVLLLGMRSGVEIPQMSSLGIGVESACHVDLRNLAFGSSLALAFLGLGAYLWYSRT